MAKQKTIWCCAACGQKQLKWSGQCPQCQGWNSFEECLEVVEPHVRSLSTYSGAKGGVKPQRIKEIDLSESPRMQSDIDEFDRLIGGGIVEGSLTLVGGDPGIGKSTMLLQIANSLAQKNKTVLYVCGEESVAQTSMRAQRLSLDSDNLLLFSETNFDLIRAQIESIDPMSS